MIKNTEFLFEKYCHKKGFIVYIIETCMFNLAKGGHSMKPTDALKNRLGNAKTVEEVKDILAETE